MYNPLSGTLNHLLPSKAACEEGAEAYLALETSSCEMRGRPVGCSWKQGASAWLTLQRQFARAVACTGRPLSISPPPPSMCRLLWILFQESPVWVGPPCRLDPLFTRGPSPFTLSAPLANMGYSRAEPVGMSYVKPRGLSQLGDGQTLPFHTLS